LQWVLGVAFEHKVRHSAKPGAENASAARELLGWKVERFVIRQCCDLGLTALRKSSYGVICAGGTLHNNQPNQQNLLSSAGHLLMTFTTANCSTSERFSALVSDPSEIRSTAAKLGDELDHENTYLEMIRFLPSATVAEFIDHLRQVADIEDLI
jgi:hypothetical protein